jgi:effector-binding domain-containing protein
VWLYRGDGKEHEMAHEVEIVKVPATTVAVIRFHVGTEELPSIGERMGRAFGTVMTELDKVDVTPSGPALAFYEPAADGFEVAAGFRVPATVTAPPALERLDLDEVEAAHTVHIGPYSELPTAYEDLQTHAEGAGRALETGRPMWEEYWSEPGTPDDQIRTEIYWPVSAPG